MRRKLLSKRNLHIYSVFILIILSGILVFYLSCKSKIPTEANAPSDGLLTAQAEKNPNQTTTTSSTTTTIKPKQSPTTTTLITSRTLTSTSIRTTTTSTTTTSIPTTRTTSSIPTTSTTSIGPPRIAWCSFEVVRIGDNSTVSVSQRYQIVYLPQRLQGFVICQYFLRNAGGRPAENVRISVNQVIGNRSHYQFVWSTARFSDPIPNTGRCGLAVSWPCIVMLFNSTSPGEEFTIVLIENISRKKFPFKIVM